MYFNAIKEDTNIDSELQKRNNVNYKKIIGISSLTVAFIIILYIAFYGKKLEYYLDINGNIDYVMYADTDYIEPGYRAYDNRGNDYSSSVVINGIVDTSSSGEYIITYSFNNIVKTRNVDVISNDNSHRTYLILKGDKIVYLRLGEEYIEEGYDVIDNGSVDLVNDVLVESNVDIYSVGTYVISYSLKNEYGIVVNASRTVIVMSDEDVSISATPSLFTNGTVTLNIGVVGDYFDYIIMPDGSIINDRFSTYTVSENGTYTFNIYNKNGEFITKDYDVKNIDMGNPSGKCTGYYKNGKSYITVDATDDYSGISRYITNDQIFANNNIVLDREFSSVGILLYDEANNSGVVSCSLNDQNSLKNISYEKCKDNVIYNGTKYSLTQKQKEKLAAMAYGEDSYSMTGLRSVISHMANLYESKKWSGAISAKTSFYDYITTTEWYSINTRNRKYKASKMSYIIPVIDDILVNGRRTIPLYVDEFDLFPNDIRNAKNVGSYVKGKTLYNNKYGAKNVTFWCFSLNSNGNSGNIYGSSNTNYRNYILSK